MRWITRHVSHDDISTSCGLAGPHCMRDAGITGTSDHDRFEKDEIGKPPGGFSFALTGQGRPGVWLIKKDDATHGNVLAQIDTCSVTSRPPASNTRTPASPRAVREASKREGGPVPP